jgi:hypothetical protein
MKRRALLASSIGLLLTPSTLPACPLGHRRRRLVCYPPRSRIMIQNNEIIQTIDVWARHFWTFANSNVPERWYVSVRGIWSGRSDGTGSPPGWSMDRNYVNPHGQRTHYGPNGAPQTARGTKVATARWGCLLAGYGAVHSSGRLTGDTFVIQEAATFRLPNAHESFWNLYFSCNDSADPELDAASYRDNIGWIRVQWRARAGPPY